MDFRAYFSVDKRRKAVEDHLKINLSNISNYSFNSEVASTKNCENMIGAVQVPLGIVGPLRLNSENSKEYFVPLATTEGALVASVSRGCKAIHLSNGANVYSYKVGTTRGPVFYTGSLEKSKELYKWIKENEKVISIEAKKTSSHLTFKKVMVKGTADYVFARFYFDTQDAMGMNMSTIATEAIIKRIEEETGISALSVAGNFDIDKKASWINFIDNRGIKAWAEVIINKSIVETVLKTTSERLFDVWLAKCMIGSAMSGSLGFNAHFANIIAAMYIATGQDAAHVVEGSLGITTMKLMPDKSLYVSVYLPALMVGVIGGGTELATQKESLDLLKLDKRKSVLELAQVVAGAVLAGEVSLLSSLAEGSLSLAHQRLGRGVKK